MEAIKLSDISPTFCVFPFIHFQAGPKKHWKLCCVSNGGILNENGEPYLLQKHTPKELWNNTGMKQIRKKMWEGQKLSQCSHCYYQESIGQESYRQRSNKKWLQSPKIRHIIYKCIKNKFHVKENPCYIDLKPDNLCNLRCRMCNSENSSQIEMEWRKLKNNPDFQQSTGINPDTLKTPELKETPWEKKEEFYKSIIDWTENLKELYLTGGEPTLIESNWKLIDQLIMTKRSRFIKLMFNINCTRVPKKLTNTFYHFNNVCLNLSLDGLKQVNDYIRYPSRWEEVEGNVKQLLIAANGKNVKFRITPVIQIYNILNLCELFVWTDNLEKSFSRRITIDPLILTSPPYLDIRILPKNIRKLALNRIKDYLKNSERTKWDRIFKNYIESIIYILENTIHNKRESLLFQFKKYALAPN